MGSYQPGRFVFHQMIEQGTVSLTTEAVAQLKSLLSKESNPGLGLRVFVSGGGCSGLQYGMAFDDNVRPGDDVIEQDGVKVLVDDFSAPYIRGSEIDYVDSLMGAGFTVHNPNAVHSCSCGHSFDTGDDAGSASSCGCGH
jgi:iron-sulfur cluster assembly accessory protein